MSDNMPDKVRAVIPMWVCRDAASEINFCKTVFNAVELSGVIASGGYSILAANCSQLGFLN